MAEQIRWKPKRDRDGNIIPRCWLTDTGYTVAQFRVNTAISFAITRPGQTDPCMRTPDREEVAKLIEADMASLGAAHG